jgi:hypothetical protein
MIQRIYRRIGIEIFDRFVPSGEGFARIVKEGQILRITETEGKQVADMTALNAYDYKETYHAGMTVTYNILQVTGNIYWIEKLYSKPPRNTAVMHRTETIDYVPYFRVRSTRIWMIPRSSSKRATLWFSAAPTIRGSIEELTERASPSF